MCRKQAQRENLACQNEVTYSLVDSDVIEMNSELTETKLVNKVDCVHDFSSKGAWHQQV